METCTPKSNNLRALYNSSDTSYLQTQIPPELLLVIIIFLPPHDKLRLRATCRRLYGAVSDSSAWPTVSFRYYRLSDRRLLDKVIDLCLMGCGNEPKCTKLEIALGRSVKRFPLVHFMDRITALSRLHHLSLVGFDNFSEEMVTIVKAIHMFHSLTHLKLDGFHIGIDSKRPYRSWLPSRGSPLIMELSVGEVVPHTIQKLFSRWSINNFWPRVLRLSSKSSIIDVKIHKISHLLHRFSYNAPPSDDCARFQLMKCESPLGIFPSRPFLELTISSTSTLSMARFGDCQLLLAAESATSVHPVQSTVEHLIVEETFPTVAPTLVCLSLRGCPEISSHCLEEIATLCPLLESLDIELCSMALSQLDGLAAIAKKCLRLKGLNLNGIHCVGNTKILWHILSRIKKLSCLSVEYCCVPFDSEVQEDVLSALVCLEIGSMLGKQTDINCIRCRSASDRYLRILSLLLPSNLRLLKMSLPASTIGEGLKALLAITPNLQCISIDKCCPGSLRLPTDDQYYQCLEKFYLKAKSYEVSSEFIEALSCKRRLTHFYAKIRTISSDAVGKLLQLPQLASCHILSTSRAYNKTNICRAAKAQGIIDFSYSSELSLLQPPPLDADFRALF